MKLTNQIVVVEDDPSVLRLLTTQAPMYGFSAVEMRTVGEAWRFVRENPPAAAVIDIGLPGIDGWELVRRIRSDVALQALPIVIISGRLDAEAQRLAKDHRCQAVEKPFDPHEVFDALVSATADDLASIDARSYDVTILTDATRIDGVVDLDGDDEDFFDAWGRMFAGSSTAIHLHAVSVTTLEGKLLEEVASVLVPKAQVRCVWPRPWIDEDRRRD